jgi:thiol-disulfide isomerase/thioredoxin
MDPDCPNEFRRAPSRAGRFFGLLLLLALIVFAIALLTRSRGLLRPRGAAPEIKAAGWVNGEAPTKESLKGKVVVVCVWATWCGPCQKEAPHLVQVHRQFADRGVVFLGLTSDGEDQLANIHRFLNTFGITWPNGYGAIETMRALNAEFIPALYVIGADGQLLWVQQEDGGRLESAIELALRDAKTGL